MGTYNVTRRVETLQRLFNISSHFFVRPEFDKMSDEAIKIYILNGLRNYESREHLIRDFELLLEQDIPINKEVEVIIRNIINNPKILDGYRIWT